MKFPFLKGVTSAAASLLTVAAVTLSQQGQTDQSVEKALQKIEALKHGSIGINSGNPLLLKNSAHATASALLAHASHSSHSSHASHSSHRSHYSSS